MFHASSGRCDLSGKCPSLPLCLMLTFPPGLGEWFEHNLHSNPFARSELRCRENCRKRRSSAVWPEDFFEDGGDGDEEDEDGDGEQRDEDGEQVDNGIASLGAAPGPIVLHLFEEDRLEDIVELAVEAARTGTTWIRCKPIDPREVLRVLAGCWLRVGGQRLCAPRDTRLGALPAFAGRTHVTVDLVKPESA